MPTLGKGPASLRRQFSFSERSFGNSQSSGSYGSFKPLSLPNNPTSWEVLILRCWLPLGIPRSIFVCVNRCAVIFTQQLPTLNFFHPESFARDLNSVLTNHPGRKRGVGVWEEILHNKNFGESFPCGVIISKVLSLFFRCSFGVFCLVGFFAVQRERDAAAPQPTNVTLCLVFCLC